MAGSGYLHRYFLSNANKRLHKWIHYFDIYERHLERFRGRNVTMVEVGVFGGGSLAMWKSYLGEGARIVGIDIDPECKQYEAPGIEVFIGSQDDPSLIAQVQAKYPDIAIVLDDGSHIMHHMIATFEMLYPAMSADGVYMAEDVHTSYMDEYGGGTKRAGSFMEYVKDRLDDVHASWANGAIPISPFTRSTDSVCVYDSIVVFERRPQAVRQSLITNPM